MSRELVLRQREVVVDEAHFSFGGVLILETFDRLFVQRLARRALEIAEQIDPDGGSNGAERTCRARRLRVSRIDAGKAHHEGGESG
jgi:hypothetical protein